MITNVPKTSAVIAEAIAMKGMINNTLEDEVTKVLQVTPR